MTTEEVQRKITPLLQHHGIEYAAVFGSVARGQDRPDSDVDLLVRFGKPTGMFGYMKLIEALEQALQRKVDVVTERSLNRHIKPYITADLKTIYEK